MQSAGRTGTPNCGDLISQPLQAFSDLHRGRGARTTWTELDRRDTDGSWMGPTQACRDTHSDAATIPAIDLVRAASLEELPIALRIATVAFLAEPETGEAEKREAERARRELELIGGLVRTLSRGPARLQHDPTSPQGTEPIAA